MELRRRLQEDDEASVMANKLSLAETLSPSKMMPPPSGSDPPSVHGDDALLKRKHHRRAKRKRMDMDMGSPRRLKGEKAKSPRAPSAKDAPGKPVSVSVCPTASNKKKRPVYLRPTNGPLLNAPRNSTQFIINDHENEIGLGGEGGECEPLGAAAPRTRSLSDAARERRENISPDDDTFWVDYSERDFQSVYETAHQEEVAEWDRKKLCDEIATLERRQKELIAILARVDPEIYLQKLQSELTSLQEANRRLRQEKADLDPALPDSSTVAVEEDSNLDGPNTYEDPNSPHPPQADRSNNQSPLVNDDEDTSKD
eukprot:maker-scaffold98_size375582-snap-gene-2.33 protein:Tk06129 transcript:maker-scaffold98_size375582-snap-gene-2.33-mRNA-1 annotation:"hypothetical protein DAPPUDRAFT_227990"